MLKLKAQLVEFQLLDEDQHKIRFRVKLRLTFANEGSEPVLLLKQQFAIGAEMLARNCEEARIGTYLYTSRQWPSVSRAPEWARWSRKLDTATPPVDLLFVLPPGNSVSDALETTIYIEKAGNFDRTNKPWDEIKRTATICLQVQVGTWPANLEQNRNPEGPTFGQTLQQRWKSYGRLQLERLTSEPVELSLP